jgi:hypothetical protein
MVYEKPTGELFISIGKDQPSLLMILAQ